MSKMKNRKLDEAQQSKFRKRKYDVAIQENVILKSKHRKMFNQAKNDSLKIKEIEAGNVKLAEWYILLREECTALRSENEALQSELQLMKYRANKYKEQLEGVRKKPIWKKVFGL